MGTAIDYETLHEASESQGPPWRESRLISLADMMLGGIAESDKCGRWQRFMGFDHREKLARRGWSFDPDLCPISNKEQPR